MSPAFVLTSLVIVATPGTGALFTIAAGLARGPRASILAAFACTLGTVPHLLAAITGLAALLHASGAAAVRDHVLRRPRVLDGMRRLLAATFAALGARPAVESR